MRGNASERQPFEARFRRYECKYVIPESMTEEIRHYIRPFVDVDPHAAGSPDRSYDINSLYLDAPDLKLFWESQEGVLNRIKLRIRSYCECEDAPMFLEIKRRHNRLVLKGRARLERSAVAVMLAGGAPDTSGLRGEERACYDEFVGWVARWITQPVIWVRYRREAFVGAMNPGIRITMDRNLSCVPATGMNGIRPAPSWRPLESRRVVLELKFNRAFPDWMGGLVKHFCLKQRSYSKYANAVRRGLDDWLLPPDEAWALPSM